MNRSSKNNAKSGKASPGNGSTPSKKARNAKRTRANAFDACSTLEKSSAWTKFVRHNPDCDALFTLVIQKLDAGKIQEGVRLMEALVRRFPEQAPLHWYLGGLYLSEAKQPKKAVSHFQKAVRLAPKSERASLGLFHALWDTNRVDEALAEIKRYQLLTNWKCQDYREIIAELNDKWLDNRPRHSKKNLHETAS